MCKATICLSVVSGPHTARGAVNINHLYVIVTSKTQHMHLHDTVIGGQHQLLHNAFCHENCSNTEIISIPITIPSIPITIPVWPSSSSSSSSSSTSSSSSVVYSASISLQLDHRRITTVKRTRTITKMLAINVPIPNLTVARLERFQLPQL